MLATITVNSADGALGDGDLTDGRCDTGSGSQGTLTGSCTIRAAAEHAAVTPGLDTIRFNIQGSGVPRISLNSLVAFYSPVVLDATTQPGAGTVEIRSPNGVFSLLTGSSGSTIRGFVINSVAGGIGINTDNNRIVGNRFGTDPTGMLPLPITGNAIGIFGSRNTIGGTSPEDRNIIANAAGGVDVIQIEGLSATDNVIRGNYIGTNVSGNAAMGNSNFAVQVLYAPSTTIEDNLIAASGIGVSVAGNTATGTVVRGNKIGTDVTGAISDPDQVPGNGNDFGNGKGIFVNDAPGATIENNVVAGSTGIFVGSDYGYGIHLANANASGAMIKGNRIGVNTNGDGMLPNAADGIFIAEASNITIGGTSEADRNIISGNGGDGVTIYGRPATPAANNHILGNFIGVDVTGKKDFGNKFRGVHIDSNAPNNIVGGDASNERNIISGNDSDGVIIALAGASGNVVKGNYIGTDIDGSSDLGNGNSDSGNNGSGIFILEASGNRIGESAGSNFVGNVISGNAGSGVRIQGTTSVDNVVAGNLIGTDKTGVLELPNDEHGVYILEAQRNRVGDVFSGLPSSPNFPGNVIAAKEYGVRIEGLSATRNEVLSNLIGVDISGAKAWSTVALAGVHVLNAPNNRIGVPNVGTGQGGNTLSHNQHGILIQSIGVPLGTGSLGAIIGGNYIGTDRSGQVSSPPSALGNLQEGIQIEGFANNYVGGQPTGSPELPSNTIAGNAGNGVSVIGARAVGNTIQGNSIHSNGMLGIDLAANGITGKDFKDIDPGPNELQNSPFVVPVVRLDGKYELVGTLHSTPESAFRIEFFANDFADPSGFGEGQTLIGFLDNVTTNTDGDALFTFQPTQRPAKGFITATATNLAGNTSEFSCGAPAAGILAEGHVFGVTTTADDQPGSLRHAIELANAHAGLDMVAFCLTGSGTQTIRPSSPLPTITDPIFIDGLTFTTATVNSNELKLGSNASLIIELDGSDAGPDAHGLHITGGDSFIQGLVINRFQGAGILLEGKGGTAIDSTYVGTNVLGSSALPNLLAGIKIQDSSNNFVGSHLAGSRNLISGNVGSGIEIVGAGSTNNLVDGSLIGTDATGTESIANGTGVRIADAGTNRIGQAGNVISGNAGDGIEIIDTDNPGEAKNNVILRNLIGTNAVGDAVLANIRGVYLVKAAQNQIGGTFEDGNLISANVFGVVIEGVGADLNLIQGNKIGTDLAGETQLANLSDGVRLGGGASGNLIGGSELDRRNIISGNWGDGIAIRGNALSPASQNLIRANTIGLNLAGSQALPNGLNGIRLGPYATNNVVGGSATDQRNVISGNTKAGVLIEGTAEAGGLTASKNQIEGNVIGLLADGVNVAANEIGVFIKSASLNWIGGLVENSGNVISGNTESGVRIDGTPAQIGLDATQNHIQRNLIGTNLNGTSAAANAIGVSINSASFNVIGGTTLGDGNVISGNKTVGVRIEGTTGQDALANELLGNRIGTQSDGETELGNLVHGVLIIASDDNLIGGETGTVADACAGACNIIAFNGKDHPAGPQRGHGIVIVADASKMHGTGNTIQRNSIHSNYGRGIDLGNDSFTKNDVAAADGDPDKGANDLQDYPVVTRVVYTGTDPNDDPANPLPALGMNKRIYWTLNSTPNRTFTVEFFANDDPDPNGFGEGKQFLAAYTVETDAKGNLETATDEAGVPKVSTDELSFFIDIPMGQKFVSATATDQTTGSTSEFSMVDSDADAIADAWETQGIDHDGDGEIEPWEMGTIDFDEDGTADHVTPLFLPGANPNHKDLFVEVDLMLGVPNQPTQAILDEINSGRVGMNEGFSNAPNQLVQNPDGTSGIHLHAIISDTGLVNTPYTDSDGDNFSDGWTEFDALKLANFGNPAIAATPGNAAIPTERAPNPNSASIIEAKKLVYRYTIFGDSRFKIDPATGLPAMDPATGLPKIDSTSGLAELPNARGAKDEGPFGGNDFQVTLGDWGPAGAGGGNIAQQQGTFMHELGHTLGLGHGGAANDGTNYKPNYYSVQSYMWQTPSDWNGWRLDYSPVDFGDLDEAALDEATGVISTTVAADRLAAEALANGNQTFIGRLRVAKFFVDQPPIDNLGFKTDFADLYDTLDTISQLDVGTVLTPIISSNPTVYGADLPPLTAADIANAEAARDRLYHVMSSGAMPGAIPVARPFDWSGLPVFNANGVPVNELYLLLADIAVGTHNGDGMAAGTGVPPAPPDNEETGIGPRDVNGDRRITVLAGHEDWSKLRFYFLESVDGDADGVHTPHDVDNMTFDPAREITMDFGDAPNDGAAMRYPTLLEDDGARHTSLGINNPLLGVRVDLESNGNPNAAALGDDENNGFDFVGDPTPNSPDDEDGVRFDTALIPGQAATTTLTVQLPIGILDEALLDAWIDFNADGDWDDAGEKIFDSVVVVQGENALEYNVPADANVGTTFARFRLSTVGGLTPRGPAPDGEVEDYAVEIGELVTTDINIQRFETNASQPLSNLSLTYAIGDGIAPAFEFAFYASSSPRFDSTATEIGQRMAITDSADRTLGMHTLVLDAANLSGALADPDIGFIIVVADPANVIAESDEANNDLHFVGLFHASNAPGPLVVRGNDAAGRISSATADVVSISSNAGTMTIGMNGDSRDIAVAIVSNLVVLTHSGDDQLQLGSLMPFAFRAGDGQDSLRLTSSGLQLDLTPTNADIQDVEVLDIRGAGANRTALSPEDVVRLSGGTNVLLLRHDEDDLVEFTTTWNITPPIFANGEPLHVIQGVDAELRIANTRPWRNPLRPLDTSRNDLISPMDLLHIINSLNAGGSPVLPVPTNVDELPAFYIDTNGDGLVSPIDALQVINFLNSTSPMNGEGELATGLLFNGLDVKQETAAFPLIVSKPFAISDERFDSRLRERIDQQLSVDHFFAQFNAKRASELNFDLPLERKRAWHNKPRLSETEDTELASLVEPLNSNACFESQLQAMQNRWRWGT